eukprot:748352-Hanusia_phi.AAC.4
MTSIHIKSLARPRLANLSSIPLLPQLSDKEGLARSSCATLSYRGLSAEPRGGGRGGEREGGGDDGGGGGGSEHCETATASS